MNTNWKKCYGEHKINRTIDWRRKKSWETKRERKSFLEVKARYDKMKRRKYYRQNFLRFFFLLSLYLTLTVFFVRSWLFPQLYWYSISFFFTSASYFHVRSFAVYSVLFAFHCALSYLFLIVSSPWNVLLTFSDFSLYSFFFLLFSLSVSFTLFHCCLTFLCCVRCTSQHKTNTHRKVLNFIQDFYLIRITYISNSSSLFFTLYFDSVLPSFSVRNVLRETLSTKRKIWNRMRF